MVAVLLLVGGVALADTDASLAHVSDGQQPASAESRLEGQPSARQERLLEQRAKARERIEADRALYGATQLADIEARYRSAHMQEFAGLLRGPAAEPILLDLVAKYPKSNRAGCALLELARGAQGDVRKRYLEQAIAMHSDAWFETGVQVGAAARALLATYYAGLERWDEAERVAQELSTDYKGSLDEYGWPLDDVLTGVMLLRSRK